jgi:putative ABC transport system permease protein
MPIAAFERAFGAPASLQVFAKASDVTRTQAAEDHARISMRARRHLGPGAADTFDIITPEASRSLVTAITQRLGAAGPPISLMALVAAIVVITNTTLVSVTQRMREIGIRRAVGASRANLLVETLAESSVIALAGGAVGLAVAAGVLSLAAGAVGVPLALEWPTAIGSLVAAGLSGVLAGWYPARRATALDVITALRQE